uniref:uncharacterized protein LOC120325520 n=1 Tax=Styela clava TaxID=7725 RepID=UPI00193AB126|nr:uncharacterized protein LOC120325520 [Styela clava]
MLTYFNSVNQTQIQTSTTSVCLQKQISETTIEEVQQWYIAIVLIPCLLLGFILAILILWLIQKFCIGRSFVGTKNDNKDKMVAEDSHHSPSSSEKNTADLSHAIASDGAKESSRILELCEINDIITSENQVQNEKAKILELLLDSLSTDGNKTSRRENATLLKNEIHEETEKALQEKQKMQSEIAEKNYQRLSDIQSRQQNEMEQLKSQLANLNPEVRDELLSLVHERHKLEKKEEEYLSVLKMRESERRAKDGSDVRCQIYYEKLNAILNNEDNNYPSATRDGYMLLMEQASKIMEDECTRIHIVERTRKNEIDKIRENELNTRKSWNKFGQVLIESVKNVCRELQLETEVRKTMTAFIKEEMMKIKTFFDQEMSKERADYIRTCLKEKHKICKKITTSNISTRGVHENPIGWMEECIRTINSDLLKNIDVQQQYDQYAINLWNTKLKVVLQSTSEKMEALKAEVIQKLAQNGASKNSAEDFINKEIAEIKIEKSEETAFPLQPNAQLGSRMRAQEIIIDCHSKVLKHFVDSQVFPTEKTADEAFTHVQAAQHRKTKISLRHLREIIERHTMAIDRKNKIQKQRGRKGYLKSSSNEETIRSGLQTQLEKWQKGDDIVPTTQSNASVLEFRNNMKSVEQNLTKAISTELAIQMEKKSALDLINLDLNALERLMMTLLHTLVSDRKLTTAECNVVLQEHKNQIAELQKLASQRTRRRLDQVVRKRLHSPPPRPFVKDEKTKEDIANSQVKHHLDVTKGVGDKAKRKIKEDNTAAKEKYELLLQLYEQQAVELRELNLKVIQALVKVAKISSMEMNACLTLLLHHRNAEQIRMMLQVIYVGVKDETSQKSNLLPAIRGLIAQQKHRLAENILRTDEDFGPTPIQTSHKLQRIKQPHRVTFHDDTPALKRDRFSPLPDIRPEPVGRTSTPDLEPMTEYQTHPNTLFSNYSDQPLKPIRKRKKKSLKNLNFTT